jgi:hypothetical protein
VCAGSLCGQTDGLRAFGPSPGVSASAYYRTGYMAVCADETGITAIIIIIIIIIVAIISSSSNLVTFAIKTIIRFISRERRF